MVVQRTRPDETRLLKRNARLATHPDQTRDTARLVTLHVFKVNTFGEGPSTAQELGESLRHHLLPGRRSFALLLLCPACLSSLLCNLTSASLREGLGPGTPSNQSALHPNVAALLGTEDLSPPRSSKVSQSDGVRILGFALACHQSRLARNRCLNYLLDLTVIQA